MKPFRGRRPTIGVFGGAFDPPHVGHALLPGYLLARGLVDRVLVAPVADHPLGKTMRPFAARLAMTRAAMEIYDRRVDVSDVEDRLASAHGGASVSLRLLEAVAAEHPHADIRLVVGADIVASGETARWHRWSDIERRFAPLVVPRVGFSPPGECVLPRVSSTEIRDWIASSDPADAERLAAAVPAGVLPWIQAPMGPPAWIVGHGHVATHAVPWLRARGVEAVLVSGRQATSAAHVWPEPAPAGIWIAVADPAIAAVAAAIARADLPRHVPVLHAAGGRVAAEALASAAAAGHPVGTLHPICALRREHPWPSPLRHATLGIEGDPAASALARTWAGDQPCLDLQALSASDRRAYHGACALVANHLAVPWQAGASVLRGQGHDPGLVDDALVQLLRSALDNLTALGIPAGVTGPVARGDRAAVAAHVAALPPAIAGLYQTLSDELATLLSRITAAR